MPNSQHPTPNAKHSDRSIILLFDHTASLGGGEIALLHLVQKIDKERYEPVVVLGAEGPLAEKLSAAGIETHVLPLSTAVADTRKDSIGFNVLLRIRALGSVLQYAIHLARFIRKRRVHIIHANSLKADIIGAIAARLTCTPIIWHVRDRIAPDYLPKLVVHVFRWLCGWVPDYVIVNSRATGETVGSRAQPSVVYTGVAVHGFSRVVYDGIDRQQHALETESSTGNPRVGLVGRISPWKGQHIFLKAARKVLDTYPEAQFQIIGSAMFGEREYEAEIRTLCSSLDLDGAVEFTGFRADVPELIASLDILVHASTTGEPFGQVVIEGMAAGKPVVATNGGGIPEIVVDGVTGILVPMGDADAMAAAIYKLLSSPERAREMGQQGRDRVLSQFTIEQTASQIEKVYDLILSRTR